jgi:hypothetical protein
MAASIAGVVRDSVPRPPTRKQSVCALIPAGQSTFYWRCADIDSSGAYRLDSLPLERIQISIQCQTIGIMNKGLVYDSIAFTQPTVVRRDWVVDRAGCDPRPLRRVTGVFRGHYTPGFESSEFVPCAADAWFLPGDSLNVYRIDMRNAWADWPTRADRKVKWPDAPRDSYGNPRFYVRWRGTVEGPGNYGHMGVSAFGFNVDSVLDVRAPRPTDCR